MSPRGAPHSVILFFHDPRPLPSLSLGGISNEESQGWVSGGARRTNLRQSIQHDVLSQMVGAENSSCKLRRSTQTSGFCPRLTIE